MHWKYELAIMHSYWILVWTRVGQGECHNAMVTMSKWPHSAQDSILGWSGLKYEAAGMYSFWAEQLAKQDSQCKGHIKVKGQKDPAVYSSHVRLICPQGWRSNKHYSA